MAWTTPAVVTAGQQPTAALLNEQIRDNWNALAVAGTSNWASYTPTWRAATTDPATDITAAGEYQQIGRIVVFRFNVTAGAGTTFGTGAYRWDLPVTAVAAARSGGTCQILDSGTGTYNGVLDLVLATRIRAGTGGTTLTYASPTSPMTWASGDRIRGTGFYESAS